MFICSQVWAIKLFSSDQIPMFSISQKTRTYRNFVCFPISIKLLQKFVGTVNNMFLTFPIQLGLNIRNSKKTITPAVFVLKVLLTLTEGMQLFFGAYWLVWNSKWLISRPWVSISQHYGKETQWAIVLYMYTCSTANTTIMAHFQSHSIKYLFDLCSMLYLGHSYSFNIYLCRTSRSSVTRCCCGTWHR